MNKGTRFSMHYITEEPQDIIDVVQHNEKRAISEYAEDIRLKSTPRPSSFEEGYETVIIKKWIGLLSIYPIMKTDWHWHNETWVKFIGFYPRHSAQKYAALRLCENEQEVYCELWSKGQLLRYWTYYAREGVKFGEQNVTLSSLGEGEVYSYLLKYVPPGFDKGLGNIPLLLMNDWRDKWDIVHQTRLVNYCE